MKIGITGNTGFIGTHLVEYLKKSFEIVPFEKEYFLYQEKLDTFVKQSDVIIHLAGQSKPHDRESVYIDNINLTVKLYSTIKDMEFKGHLIFVSSIHESKESYYAKSKKKSRETLSLIKNDGAKFTGLILPNVFGAETKMENSFITKFCWQLFKGEEPKIFKDVNIELIYIDELMGVFYNVIKDEKPKDYLKVKPTSRNKISYILDILKLYNDGYSWINDESFDKNLRTTWERNLQTWQS